MKRTRLGTSDLQAGRIGLGCVTFGREIDRETSFAVLDRALERGIDLLDTAAVYGEGASESVIGEWLRERRSRERVVLATKVSGQLTRKRILRSVDESQKRLGVDRLDLLQAHDWDVETPLEETLETFERLVEGGKVRWLGCSNWDTTQLSRALQIQGSRSWSELISVQPIYNLVERGCEDDLLPFCVQHPVGVITYSPLGAGFLTGKYTRDGEIPAGTRFDVKPAHRDIYCTESGFHAVDALRQTAEASGLPIPRLALAWVFRQPDINTVLIGARHPRHIDQAFEAFELSCSEEGRALIVRLHEALGRNT